MNFGFRQTDRQTDRRTDGQTARRNKHILGLPGVFFFKTPRIRRNTHVIKNGLNVFFLGHQPITLPVSPKLGQKPMDVQPVFTIYEGV